LRKPLNFFFPKKIFGALDLPYRTQITPLAAIFAILGDRAENYGIQTKIARWYWCGVFGELYGSAVESRFARDLPEVVEWVYGNNEPSTIAEANFLRTRNSAAYKGLHALQLRDGCLDFRTGDPIDVQMYFDEKIDIHHIFPREWCQNRGLSSAHSDSIVNKTPLSAKTNRMISSNSPNTYLTRIQKNADISEKRMDDILRSHVILPEALRAEDFTTFFRTREAALLRRIERAIGKPIAQEASEPNPDGVELKETAAHTVTENDFNLLASGSKKKRHGRMN